MSSLSLDPAIDVTLPAYVQALYNRFGQRKEMGQSSTRNTLPHFFLLRTFLGKNDLLVIFNTKRCHYRCAFCQLPAKSSPSLIPGHDIVSQFRYVATELRHALSIVDRVTLSNDGSVLDRSTFDDTALQEIVTAIGSMRRVRHIDFETRLEFVDHDVLTRLHDASPRSNLGMLTGFETHDPRIRDEVLKKRESLPQFLAGLDKVAQANAALTAYVLFKPDPYMSDAQACDEADNTIGFLSDQCARRGISLTIRLNPMYRAVGSKWARVADATAMYAPPRLTDVMRVAERAALHGIPVYIGLSTEGLTEDGGTYMSREDYHPTLIKYIKLFNDGHLASFPWTKIERLYDAVPVS